MALPDWAKKLLHSPAALTLLAASGAAVMGITAALEWIMVLQLSVLILVSIRNDMKRKKAKQA
jgi:hypothetical protein